MNLMVVSIPTLYTNPCRVPISPRCDVIFLSKLASYYIACVAKPYVVYVTC